MEPALVLIKFSSVRRRASPLTNSPRVFVPFMLSGLELTDVAALIVNRAFFCKWFKKMNRANESVNEELTSFQAGGFDNL